MFKICPCNSHVNHEPNIFRLFSLSLCNNRSTSTRQNANDNSVVFTLNTILDRLGKHTKCDEQPKKVTKKIYLFKFCFFFRLFLLGLVVSFISQFIYFFFSFSRCYVRYYTEICVFLKCLCVYTQ
jgi:hypothetical protein